MNKIKIDNKKTFIPLKIATGTVKERMQKARVLNLAFYDNLQDKFINDQIAPRTFISTLRKTLGAKIDLKLLESESSKEHGMGYFINLNSKVQGYYAKLPLEHYSKKIQKKTAPYFLQEIQSIINETFNPKILKRLVNMINKGYDINKFLIFYRENLSGKAILTEESLNKFLNEKSNAEKIDSIQLFRYKLISEKNTKQAKKQIDRRMERYNDFKYITDYNLDKYHYDEKFAILDAKLSEIINSERL